MIEERLIKLLVAEIDVQKKLEKEILNAGHLDEGLQTMSVKDVEVVAHYYEGGDAGLGEATKNGRKVRKLLKEARYWDKPMKERKWFHI